MKITEAIYPSLPRGYITKSTVGVITTGGLLFIGYELATLNEKFYRDIAMPIVHRLVDPEKAHELAIRMAKRGWMTSSAKTKKDYPELECNVLGRNFKNPIGIAAGFDKNGEAIEHLSECGIGFVEVGSVTPLPQPGNPKPRLFRIPKHKAVINRYGFNSDGMGAVSERVRNARGKCGVPLGVNLGKNKDSRVAENDYELGASYFASHSDYLVINVSSPNTPGLRSLQTKKELVKILNAVNGVLVGMAGQDVSRTKPALLLKISPDLSDSEKQEVANVCLNKANGVDGLIVTNTTTSRPCNIEVEMCGNEPGGLSGEPLKDMSTKCIAEMYKLTNGKIPIIGCGGVSSGEEAYKKIRAGASLVQFYTALVYQGFPATGQIKRELAECIRRDNLSSVKEAVGYDFKTAELNRNESWWKFW